MDREMKRHYTLLVDFLGKILGPDYEVALHELLDDSNEIIAIANGELTGRHLGSPLSNKMLEFLTSRLYETQDYVLRFESTSVTGKKLCSNSLFIKDPHGRLVGLLCINFDSSRYRELSARVMDLCGSLLTPGAPSGTHLIVENDEHTYPSSIAGATASIVSSVIADYPVPVDRLTQDEKMEIMDALNRKGVFLLKGSVSHVARASTAIWASSTTRTNRKNREGRLRRPSRKFPLHRISPYFREILPSLLQISRLFGSRCGILPANRNRKGDLNYGHRTRKRTDLPAGSASVQRNGAGGFLGRLVRSLQDAGPHSGGAGRRGSLQDREGGCG